jgi:hypothetical protein
MSNTVILHCLENDTKRPAEVFYIFTDKEMYTDYNNFPYADFLHHATWSDTDELHVLFARSV